MSGVLIKLRAQWTYNVICINYCIPYIKRDCGVHGWLFADFAVKACKSLPRNFEDQVINCMNIECVLHYMINIIKDCTDRTQESKLHPFLLKAKPQTPKPQTPFYSYVLGANLTFAHFMTGGSFNLYSGWENGPKNTKYCSNIEILSNVSSLSL